MLRLVVPDFSLAFEVTEPYIEMTLDNSAYACEMAVTENSLPLNKEELGVVGPSTAKQKLQHLYLGDGSSQKSPFEGGRGMTV